MARALGVERTQRWLVDGFELAELHVLPAYQAAGTGRQLLRDVMARAAAAHVTLSTPDLETPARRLYRSEGFVDLFQRLLLPGQHGGLRRDGRRPVSARRRDVVVVGSGHNGLIAACYLARAGLDVEVVERDSVAGGAVSTVQRWPGVRVDRGSSIHVMIRHTGIVEDLGLDRHGLVYDDVEPWGVVPDPAGPLRFSGDLDETCASIEASCGSQDADAYRRFVGEWTPRMRAYLDAAGSPPTATGLGRAMRPLFTGRPRGWGDAAHAFLRPAEDVLDETFTDPRLRAALAWWAAQSGPPPHEPGRRRWPAAWRCCTCAGPAAREVAAAG